MGKYHGYRDVKKIHYDMGALLNEEKRKEILTEAFKRRVGYDLDWENPKTMNEKIMWLKMYYQDPLITRCADKYAVKEYVKQVAGEEYIVPTIGTWSDPDDIDFDALPDRFVLKVNWSSGYNIIVSDKSKLDIEDAKRKLSRWIKPDRNAYYQYFNWGYKHMKPVIYAEEYLEQIDNQVYDYKFFMCGGKFEYMLIATDRSDDESLTHDFFDSDFKHLPVAYDGLKNAASVPEKPKHFDKMVEVATELAKPFPYVRVDFYEVGERIYIGEMTFYPAGGLKAFIPEEWDRRFGDMIPLPEKRIIDKEGIIFRMKGAMRRMRRAVGNAARSLRRKLIRKHRWENNKYLVVLGIRLPYETHLEQDGDELRKYIHILGMEFCYKKFDLTKQSSGCNTVMEYVYEANSRKEAFAMESSITPQIRQVHCEQKAYKQLGYFPNLKNPSTLNEKVIWLALNYKNPDIAAATDKGTAKEWISRRVGAQYVVPLIGVYDDVNDIDFSVLPDRFVAKLNDGWGADRVMIVTDKNSLKKDRTKAILSSWLYPWNNYYYQNMCITDGKMEKATIVIEEFLDAGGGASPEDYKFYCCNGEPRFALVVAGRGGANQTRSFVDMDWNVLPVARAGKEIAYDVEKPQCLETMLELCRKLSAGFPFVRVDFYEVDGRVYVGEMTFTPGMFLKFSSKAWDKKLGDYLELPELES